MRDVRGEAGLIRAFLRTLPLRSDRDVSRRLVQAAATARDGQHYRAAAALYEQALAYRPQYAGLHIQAGHMFKEAGALTQAEAHYLRAAALIPNDAELALQLGHFYKVAGRPDEAEVAYSRALVLRPGWADPADELARLGIAARTGASPEGVVPALLPRPAVAGNAASEGVHIYRLGTRTKPTPWGDLKRLSGIEAIRGRCVSEKALDALHILIDGNEVHREPLAAGGSGYVFNAWIDVGAIQPGAYRVELRFVGGGKVVRVHRETVAIVASDPQTRSDAWIDAPGTGPVEARVAALPSPARPASRTPFAGPFRNILIQRADQLGDMAASVPAIRRLRALFPDARLVGLVTPANAGLAESLGLFDEMVEVRFEEDRTGRRAFSAEAQLALRTRLAAFALDLAIDLGQVADSRPLLLLSGARHLYGFADASCPWLDAGFALGGHDPINRHDIVPPARKLLALVEALAAMLDAPEPAPRGAITADAPIVLHDGARLEWSRWPHYPALARMLLAHTDRRIVLLGAAPGDLADPRLTVIDHVLPFDEFDALLAGCALFVGNDSGPKHLAALRGAPVLSLHMARLNWSEWGQEASGTILSRRVPCAGCGIVRPEDCAKGFTCIRSIRPEEALTEALRLLAP